jgi:hypothetical protein
MPKSEDQLDREIAAYLRAPKIGDPAWEREWANLLHEKHSKARMPTMDELARALRYLEREYVFDDDGRIDMEQWAEGLAFGQRFAADAWYAQQAREVFPQLAPADWLRIAERANYLAHEQGERANYLKRT